MNWLGLTFSFTEREYLSLGVNMLTNNLKISDTTETQFFELIFFQSDRKIYRKYSCADLRSDSDPLDPLTCWLSISVLTRGFLVISVTPHFAVYNFWKKTTFEADLVFQSILNFVQISEMQKKIQKTFFDSEIIAFQLIALNTRFYWEAIQFIGCQYGNKMSQDFRYY